ncbi:IF27A protein, partial [Polypterus senegalus]
MMDRRIGSLGVDHPHRLSRRVGVIETDSFPGFQGTPESEKDDKRTTNPEWWSVYADRKSCVSTPYEYVAPGVDPITITVVYDDDAQPKVQKMGLLTIAAFAGGAAVTAVGAPVVLGAIGFTSAGIAAGSIAAKMMSAAAIANGGGVAAGSLVAVLQSVALTVAIVTVVLGTIGFTSAGIASGSVAAKMMSAAAIANGGRVAASTGLGIAGYVAASTIGGLASYCGKKALEKFK